MTKALRDRLGISRRTLMRRLAELTKRDIVATTRPTHSPKQTYRIVGEGP